MKTRLITAIFVILTGITLFAQENRSLLSIQTGESKLNLGGYISTNLKYSSWENKPAGFLDLKAAVTFNSKWAVGLSATGLYYDKKLSKIVNDGTYHIYAGYTGIFLERMFYVTDEMILSLGILTGQGEAYYKYDKEYRDGRPWYQEVIDKETFSVFEPSVEIQQNIGGNFYLGLSGSYRFSSPLKLTQTDEKALNTFGGGLSLKYGIF